MAVQTLTRGKKDQDGLGAEPGRPAQQWEEGAPAAPRHLLFLRPWWPLWVLLQVQKLNKKGRKARVTGVAAASSLSIKPGTKISAASVWGHFGVQSVCLCLIWGCAHRGLRAEPSLSTRVPDSGSPESGEERNFQYF